MTPRLLLDLVVRPTLYTLAGEIGKPSIDGREPQVLLIAIAIIESGLKAREQYTGGPAKSFWQIEPATAEDTLARCKHVKRFCDALLCPSPLKPVDFRYTLRYCDAAACAIARGILLLDRKRLPEYGDQQGALSCYLRNWRPGKPHPEKWPAAYKAAMDAIGKA